MKAIIAITMLVLIASIGMAYAESSPSMYMEVDESAGTIDLMVNTSEDSGAVNAWVWFDPACINITDVSYNGCPWTPFSDPPYGQFTDHVILVLTNTTGSGTPAGDYKAATLMVECVTGEACTSDIELTNIVPANSVIYNTAYTCEAAVADKSSVLYTVTVYAGQSTELTINLADFGNMKRGDTSEIIDSLTLTNNGDMDASVDAVFTTNVSATYGMVSGINTIPGNNFLLGEDGKEKPLTIDGTNVYIGIVPANGVVDYDAILSIPNDAVTGAYTGDVEVTYG